MLQEGFSQPARKNQQIVNSEYSEYKKGSLVASVAKGAEELSFKGTSSRVTVNSE